MAHLAAVSSDPLPAALCEAQIVADLLQVVACDLLLPHALPLPAQKAQALSFLSRQLVALLEEAEDDIARSSA